MMQDEHELKLLQRAAARASSDPFYLGHSLAMYKASEGIDDTALAGFLGCALDDISRIALCRQPGVPDETSLKSDIVILIERFALKRESFIHLIRRVQFIAAASTNTPTTSFNPTQRTEYLLAAQDRDDATSDPNNQDPEEGMDD
jgi:hypothetical protein